MRYVSEKSLKYSLTRLKEKFNLKTFKVCTFTHNGVYDIVIGADFSIIPFNTNNNPNDKLEILSNGTIRIGKGINKIVVSGSTSLSEIYGLDLRKLIIYKNDEIVSRTQLKHDNYQSLTLVPRYTEVVEGDIISMKTIGEKDNSAKIPCGSSQVTYMTIMIIE